MITDGQPGRQGLACLRKDAVCGWLHRNNVMGAQGCVGRREESCGGGCVAGCNSEAGQLLQLARSGQQGIICMAEQALPAAQGF